MNQIILEGITGSGKSSNVDFIRNYLEGRDISVAVADCTMPVFENSINLRRTLRDYGNPLLAQLFLHQHSNYIKILEAGDADVTLIDRHVLSNLVYTLARTEIEGTTVDVSKMRDAILRPFGLNPLEDSVVLYFDVEPQVARQRTLTREQKAIEGNVRNEFNLRFQSLAAKHYEQELPFLSCPVYSFDANKSIPVLESELSSVLEKLFEKYQN